LSASHLWALGRDGGSTLEIRELDTNITDMSISAGSWEGEG
jgi:hypothetical protein